MPWILLLFAAESSHSGATMFKPRFSRRERNCFMVVQAPRGALYPVLPLRALVVFPHVLMPMFFHDGSRAAETSVKAKG